MSLSELWEFLGNKIIDNSINSEKELVVNGQSE